MNFIHHENVVNSVHILVFAVDLDGGGEEYSHFEILVITRCELHFNKMSILYWGCIIIANEYNIHHTYIPVIHFISRWQWSRCSDNVRSSLSHYYSQPPYMVHLRCKWPWIVFTWKYFTIGIFKHLGILVRWLQKMRTTHSFMFPSHW